MKIDQHHENGATALEVAIVIGLFFFLIFGLIDLAAYVAAHNRLSYVAQESARTLSTISGLELDQVTRDQTVATVQARAFNQATVSMIGTTPHTGLASLNGGAQIDLPPAIPGIRYEDALQKAPIKVSFTATFNGTLPFLRNVPLNVDAYAYREPRSTLMMPREADCLGRPFGSAGYDSNCECQSPYTPDPNSGMCICDPNQLSCPIGGILNVTNPTPLGEAGQCNCNCPKGAKDINGTCACNEFSVPNPAKPGECVCKNPAATCPANKYLYYCECLCRNGCKGGTLDKNTCACSCPSPKVYNSSLGACICPTQCPANSKTGEDCSCECLADNSPVSPSGSCPAIGAE